MTNAMESLLIFEFNVVKSEIPNTQTHFLPALLESRISYYKDIIKKHIGLHFAANIIYCAHGFDVCATL